MVSWRLAKTVILASVLSPAAVMYPPANSRLTPYAIPRAALAVRLNAASHHLLKSVGQPWTSSVIPQSIARVIHPPVLRMWWLKMVRGYLLGSASLIERYLTCPSFLFIIKGQSCGSNGLACASGQCTSVARKLFLFAAQSKIL